MRVYVWKLIVLFTSAILSGCASNFPVYMNTGKEIDLPALQPGQAIIFGSVSVSGPLSEYRIMLRNLESGQRYSASVGVGITLIPMPMDTQFSELEPKGKVFAAVVPVGMYEYEKWIIHSGVFSSAGLFDKKMTVSVVSDCINYVGATYFVPDRVIGLAVLGARASIGDKIERDSRVLESVLPKGEMKYCPNYLQSGSNAEAKVTSNTEVKAPQAAVSQ